MAHPELEAEQAYVNHAYACLERMRAAVAGAAGAASGEIAEAALEAWSARRLQTFADAERGLCFGRLDFEDAAKPLYIGRRWVHDDDQNVVVVNWQAPASRPFYTATPADPQRVTLRRRFRTRGRALLDIADESLDGSTVDGAGIQDFLLEELERKREAYMRDIVATIQADQYRLITHDHDRPLVVQGGPGTGKTAVGLHRASWLLYTHRERLGRSGVLVVGPNRTFMEYVSHVLPTLGEEAVEQRAVTELVDGVVATRTDPPQIARLKGDLRLAEVIARAVELRQEGRPEGLLLRLEGSFVEVRAGEVAALVQEARGELGTTAAARERFRMQLLRRFYAEYGRVLGATAIRTFEEVEQALRRGGYLNRVLEHAWPTVDPERLVRTLLTTGSRLREVAEGVLAPEEQRLLLSGGRRSSAWSDGDIALLDEARALVLGAPKSYGHVILDEAQDLTPMQLRMVGRRAPSGALTVLGDIAQATGPVQYRRWAEVLEWLPRGQDAALEELRYAYRVPMEIMALALPLLERIAPDVEAPLAHRAGAAAPHVRRVEERELLPEAFREATRLAGEEGLLAVIAPGELLEQEPAPAAEHLFDDGVPVLTPRQAKGLEFDHVVVVEPALIASHEQGLRELYVALTRPTRTLVLVHARPLPRPLTTQ